MAEATRFVEWYVKNCHFEFEDAESYETWKKNPKVYFEFSPTNSADNGAAIMDSSTDDHSILEITPENGSFSVFEDDGGPCISASIFFPLDGDREVQKINLRSDLDAAALDHWKHELRGDSCGHLNLGSAQANTISDEGSGWRFTTAEELARFSRFLDGEGKEPF